MMNEPSGELVELDFYFGPQASEDCLQLVVEHCCQHGGDFAGTVLVSEGPRSRCAALPQGIYTFPVVERRLSGADLNALFVHDDTRVLKVPIWSALGVQTRVPEVVTYCAVSPEAAALDSLPVAIVSEGWVFSTPGHEREATAAGKRCYEKLVEICEALNPMYAAILSENWIPCVYDLKGGQGDDCFRNFFVSETQLGPVVVSEIEQLVTSVGAFVEKLGSGLYISTSKLHNPEATQVNRKVAGTLSSQIAHILRRSV